MRVGELARLEWRDVDVAGSRFRISQGKTASSRRFVAVPSWLMAELQESCPPDDRTPERRVFPGFTRNVAGSVMRRACTAAGLAHYHPHDLRHRYASVKIAEGCSGDDAGGAARALEEVASLSTPTRTSWSTRNC